MNAVRAVLRRFGLTEGQGYSVVILLVVAVLLTTSLTRLHGRVAELASAPGPAVTTTTALPPTTRPLTATPPAGRPPLVPPAATGSRPPAATPTTARPAPPTTPTTIDDEGTPPDEPCPADALVQGFRGVVEQLDTLVGGIVPSATLVSTIAILSGCSQTDPVVLVLAALVEIGKGLPDLGLGFLEFPVLPFLPIPVPLVDLLQPMRPALDPICDTAATVGLVLSQVGPSYPYPLDATFAVSLFYVQATCGQIRGL